MKLNIYEFDFDPEKDWVIAESKKRAIELHKDITDDIDEYKDIVSFVKKKDWESYTYHDDESDVKMTFKEYMDNEVWEEQFFCSTAN